MIQLNIPLSATALREGAEFLTKLSQLADVIRDEVRGPATTAATAALNTLEQQATQVAVHVPEDVVIDVNVRAAGGDHDKPLTAAGGHPNDAFAQDVAVAEAEVLPQQFETVVTGHERNPDYAGELAAYDQVALESAGWDVQGLLGAGYLREVTEQRPLPVAHSVSAAPPAPAPAPAAPSTSDAVELDVDGLPWDARIHSNAAERKAATGKWKTRKNLPAGYKEQIEAELRGVPLAAAPAPSAPIPPSPAAPVAPAPGPATAGGTTFAQFVQWAMGHQKAGRCNQTDVQLAVQGVGLKDVPALSQNQGKIAEVMAALKAAKGLE